MRNARMLFWRELRWRDLPVAAAALPLFGMLSPESNAGDWSLRAKTTERVDLNDNYGLKSDFEGYVFGSRTSLNADAAYQGHDYRFDLIGDLSYQRNFGAAADSTRDVLSPRIATKFNKKGKISSFDFSASLARSEADSIDELEGIVLKKKTYRDAINISSAYSYNLGPRTSIGTQFSIQNILFEDNADNLVPSIYVGVGVFATHRLTKRTNIKASTNLSLLDLDNPTNTQRRTVTPRIDVDSQLSPRLKVAVGGGPRLTLTTQDSIFAPSGEPDTSTELGWAGDFRMDYIYKLGAISAFASQAAEPSTFGDLQSRYTMGVSASRKINDVSELGFSMQYRLAEVGPDSTKTVVVISPTYSRRLVDDWSLQTGYRFTFVKDIEGSKQANNVFIAISKSLTVIP
jgi:hypothetical protein